jgi:6-phosphogluconolactonase (cycloisomerase 2 family)
MMSDRHAGRFSNGAYGLRHLDEAPLGEAAGVTVSSDGAGVYVTARLDDALTVFRRGDDGRLSVETVVRGAFDWPNAITEGADPRHLYMAAVKTSTVTTLRVSEAGDDGCGRACSSN